MSHEHKKPLWRIYEKLAVLQSMFREVREKIDALIWQEEKGHRVEIYTFHSMVCLENPYPSAMPPGFKEEALRRAKKEAVRQLAEQLMNYATVTEQDTPMGRYATVQIRLGIVSEKGVWAYERM